MGVGKCFKFGGVWHEGSGTYSGHNLISSGILRWWNGLMRGRWV